MVFKHTTSNNEVKISTQLIRNETVRMKVDCLIKSHEMHKKCIQSHPNKHGGYMTKMLNTIEKEAKYLPQSLCYGCVLGF